MIGLPLSHNPTSTATTAGTHVTTRVICQMVAFRLLSRARESGLLPSGGGGGGGGGLDDAYLNGTLDFLQGNREMSILRRKELRRFEAVSVVGNCSVAGVMGHAFAEGEFTATHLEIALREVSGMDGLIALASKGMSAGGADGPFPHPHPYPIITSAGHDAANQADGGGGGVPHDDAAGGQAGPLRAPLRRQQRCVGYIES